jgi:hypothetical protein
MTTRAPLDTFETALLGELREHVVAQNTASTAPSRWRRRLVALVAVAATAAAGFALRPDPAFAVDAQDGDIVVTISSLEDADGLEEALAKKGVTSEVDYEAEVQPPPEDRTDLEEHTTKDGEAEKGLSPKPDEEPTGGCLTSISTSMSDDAVTFRFPEAAADSDAVLKITTAGSADGPSSIAIRWEGDPC